MQNELQPTLSHVEPVISVKDIEETIQYWKKVLGFPSSWVWGNPPNHGGVSWNGVFIQFSKNPDLAAATQGQNIWIKVKRLETLYAFHQQTKANIVAPLEKQPWGMSQYTIKEINGLYIHFASPEADVKGDQVRLPATVRLIERTPTLSEYLRLITSVGWEPRNAATTEIMLKAPLFAVVAEDTIKNEVIGCVLLLGDNAGFYYVKDVMVHKEWQHKGIGTAIMQHLSNWLENNALDNAFVGLYTGDSLEPFYHQFGFTEAFGMTRRIHRPKSSDPQE